MDRKRVFFLIHKCLGMEETFLHYQDQDKPAT